MKRRAPYLVILAFSLSVYVNAHAPSSEITGLWVGGVVYLDGETWFPIRLHIREVNDELHATLDAPTQNAFDLPVKSISVNGDAFHLERITSSDEHIVLDGQLQNGFITGTFTRDGRQQGIFQLARSRSPVADRLEDATLTSGWQQDRRDTWQKVPEIFEALGIEKGSTVADLGAGDGWFTVRLAHGVGKKGRVYAVDISEKALDDLRSRVREDGLRNVAIIHSEPDDPKLSPSSLDAVLIVNAYHEMPAYEKILEHLMQALRPGGRLVIVDNKPEGRSGASREAQTEDHDLGIDFARADLERVGFEVIRVEDPFLDTSYDMKQWILVGRRPVTDR